VVDGQENPLMTIVTMKFYEVQKYVALSNHAWLGYLFMVNKGFFESLPEKYQDLVVKTAKESAELERRLIDEENQVYLATIKKSGTEVNDISPEQMKEFQRRVQPVYDWFVENIDGGKKYLDMVR
jgi:C4-dicarboxylate-binding protein DctP